MADSKAHNHVDQADNEFDPFQVFEVENRLCRVLEVKVLKGRNITKGWTGDLLDTPDPYVHMDMLSAPSGSKLTNYKDNDVNPEWNETFTFLIDPLKQNVMTITLMDANLISDESLSSHRLNVNLLPLGVRFKGTFHFLGTSEVDFEFYPYTDHNPKLRYSLALCPEEKHFIQARRQHVFEAMKDILGDRGPRILKEVPTIGVLGSGGGFRAMTSLSGVFKALVDSRVLDMVTYVAGLSGSAWYLSHLYSNPEWPSKTPGDLHQELKENVTSSWVVYLFQPSSMYKYIKNIITKKARGQPVSFTDFFGYLVGETLLPGRLDSKLTDQRPKIHNGNIPMPLYTCLHVKKHVSAMVFHEWVEFSPYEIGMPKYGTFLKSDLFGSKFFMGQVAKQHPEPPLHFLQGVWGSAFTILFSRLFEEGHNKMDPTELMRLESKQALGNTNVWEKENIVDDAIGMSDDSEGSDTSDSEGEESSDGETSRAPQAQKYTRKLSVLQKPKTPKEMKQKSFWAGMLEGLCNSSQMLKTRAGRAGMVHNFMRGLSLTSVYPYSPFDTKPGETFDGIFEMHPTDSKKLYMVDGGLTFNSPFPPVLRPQRAVDILLSFDFSMRPSDSSPPFKELKLAEKWARINHVPFPPIDESVFDREGLRECYIFRDPNDPHCPVVMHFVLVNIEFRKYKKPNVERETNEEKDFADFDIYDDKEMPYSTFNFTYTEKSFDRITQLTEFNTLMHVDLIKDVIAETIQKKRAMQPKQPIKLKHVKLLRHTNVEGIRVLRHFLRTQKSVEGVIEDSEGSDADDEDDDIPDGDSGSKWRDLRNLMQFRGKIF